MSGTRPDITVFSVPQSRTIRIVWLLEELGVPYRLENAPDGQDPAAMEAFHEKSGSPMRRYPTIRDGDLVLHESGAITEYICENYDSEYLLLPKPPALRARTRTIMHAAEGTLALHAMAFMNFHMGVPAQFRESAPESFDPPEARMAADVQKDLNWLEGELKASTGAFFVGDTVTAADTMLYVSVLLTLKYELGTKGGSWPKIQAWLKHCEGTESFKRAVAKTGFQM